MDALHAVAASAASGKSLKRRNMLWLVAVGIVDVVALLVFAFHRPVDDFTPDKMTALRSGLTMLLPVPILFLSYLLSHSQKAVIVFWRLRNPMPGSRAFSVHAPNDARIDLNALKKNVGEFPDDEHAQNAMWYRLYKLVEGDVAVLESHQNYLMFRDIAGMSILLVPLVPLVLFLFGNNLSVVVLSAAVFVVQYLIATVAARNNGVRFVQNVLSIHATRKVAASKRAAQKRTPEDKS
jgi:hypothetical protein